MYIDPREKYRRTWRIIGQTLLNEVLVPMLIIMAGGAAIAGIYKVWDHKPMMVIAGVVIAAVCWLWITIWSYAQNEATDQLKREKSKAQREHNDEPSK